MAYSGLIVDIPLGAAGLSGQKRLGRLTVADLIQAEGISYADGILSREGGAAQFNETSITNQPTVLAGHDWHPAEGVQQQIIVTSNGNIYRDNADGNFNVLLETGINNLDLSNPVFVEGGKETAAGVRKLFILTGQTDIQVLRGDVATTSDLQNEAADWASSFPTCGALHENRFWAAGNLNNPHRLYYSLPSDHENVAGGGTILVYPGEGEKIVGLASFLGLLIVFKYPRGIYFVDTSAPEEVNWRVRRVTRAVGAVSPTAIIHLPNDLLFLDEQGNIHLMSAVQEFGDINTSNLAAPKRIDEYIRTNCNLAMLPFARACYYPKRKEVHIALARRRHEVNDLRLVLDMNEGLTNVRYRTSVRDEPYSLWLRREEHQGEVLMMGETDGLVWTLDQEGIEKDGSGYSTIIQTPHMDLGDVDPKIRSIDKNGDFLELIHEPFGGWSLFIDVIWDGVLRDTINMNMGGFGYELGGATPEEDDFVLDVSTLSGAVIMARRMKLKGSGRTLSLRFRTDAANENFAISAVRLYITVGTEDSEVA